MVAAKVSTYQRSESFCTVAEHDNNKRKPGYIFETKFNCVQLSFNAIILPAHLLSVNSGQVADELGNGDAA